MRHFIAFIAIIIFLCPMIIYGSSSINQTESEQKKNYINTPSFIGYLYSKKHPSSAKLNWNVHKKIKLNNAQQIYFIKTKRHIIQTDFNPLNSVAFSKQRLTSLEKNFISYLNYEHTNTYKNEKKWLFSDQKNKISFNNQTISGNFLFKNTRKNLINLKNHSIFSGNIYLDTGKYRFNLSGNSHLNLMFHTKKQPKLNINVKNSALYLHEKSHKFKNIFSNLNITHHSNLYLLSVLNQKKHIKNRYYMKINQFLYEPDILFSSLIHNGYFSYSKIKIPVLKIKHTKQFLDNFSLQNTAIHSFLLPYIEYCTIPKHQSACHHYDSYLKTYSENIKNFSKEHISIFSFRLGDPHSSHILLDHKLTYKWKKKNNNTLLYLIIKPLKASELGLSDYETDLYHTIIQFFLKKNLTLSQLQGASSISEVAKALSLNHYINMNSQTHYITNTIHQKNNLINIARKKSHLLSDQLSIYFDQKENRLIDSNQFYALNYQTILNTQYSFFPTHHIGFSLIKPANNQYLEPVFANHHSSKLETMQYYFYTLHEYDLFSIHTSLDIGQITGYNEKTLSDDLLNKWDTYYQQEKLDFIYHFTLFPPQLKNNSYVRIHPQLSISRTSIQTHFYQSGTFERFNGFDTTAQSINKIELSPNLKIAYDIKLPNHWNMNMSIISKITYPVSNQQHIDWKNRLENTKDRFQTNPNPKYKLGFYHHFKYLLTKNQFQIYFEYLYHRNSHLNMKNEKHYFSLGFSLNF